SLATNAHLHDTYFVVAHFHYVMFGGTVMILFAGLHYWFPKMFGRMYNERVAKVAIAHIFVGFNMLYFSMFIMGYMGMPRRYWDYLPEYKTWQIISTVGSWILVSGIIIMFVNLYKGLRKGKPASANPWGGVTLEWTIPSPPPVENFDVIPEVNHGPYEFVTKEVAK
ncbi:MAG: cytochrome c oxidase subunit, partial [Bacteroidota bacterium]|nr:cytochrome c oxidase subunit [Bacteroidota bacterium]